MKKIIVLISLVFSLIAGKAQCVSTLAGSGTAGFANGTGTAVQFNNPYGVAVDASGNVYVGDQDNYRIRKVTSIGAVTTFAGSGIQGYFDDVYTAAKFVSPTGVAIDALGNVYVVDHNNSRVRKIMGGKVSTFAGSSQGFADGTGTAAQFKFPYGIAVDASGNIYVADSGNNRIRKITASGVVTTLAGSGTAGFANGTGAAAQFNYPTGVAVDVSGNVYVADARNNRIRKITDTGVVSTIAGSGVAGSVNGTSIFAQFNLPIGIAVDASGNVYVADTKNNKIRKITGDQVSTFAGSGTEGFIDGTVTSAQFSSPMGVAVDASGNVYVADTNNQRIRKITPLTVNLDYSDSTLCKNISSAQPNLKGLGAYTGGTYSSTTGLTINSTTGVITPNTSTLGPYTVTYTTPSSGGCKITTTTQVTITALPTTSINYPGSPFCKSVTTGQLVSLTGTGAYTGGTYSSGTGLSINASTGAINPSLSTAGTYTVTYTTPASGSCASISTTTQVTINAVPTASIIYSGNPFCKSLTYSPLVTLTGSGVYGGGVYSSTAGLVINTSTGDITPSTSTPGTYTVSYATKTWGGCTSFTVTTPVTITALPTATISYSGSPFCKTLTSVQASIAGTGAYARGTYTSSNGLSIDSASGTINPSLSTAGTYTVTYTTPASGGCAAVSTTTSVVILPEPTASISADGTVSTATTITNGSAVQLQLNGTLNTVPNIQWTPATAISSATVANPVVYPSATTTYTASFVNSNGCKQTTSFTVNVTPQPNIGNLSISSPNATIGLFDTVTVNVQLTNATDLYSLYMKLKGNAAVSQYLDYKGYTAGTLLGVSNVISTPPIITNGVPDFGMTKVGAVPGYAGSGLFYTFTFAPKNIVIPAGTKFCFYLDDVSAYNTSGVSCGLTNQGQYCYTFTNQLNVWPGDLNNSKTVTTADILPIGYFYNATGPARANKTIQWAAQPATLWGYNHSSTNGDAYKVFADSNGDGVINNADQAAIGFNMNRVHARVAAPRTVDYVTQGKQALAGGNLIVTPTTTIVDASLSQQTITFTVSLNNSGGLNALYGISVNVLFDENIFDLNTATVDYTGSIFGTAGTDCLVMNFVSANMVSVGLTRYANAAINGQGLLFKVTLRTKSPLTSSLTQTPVSATVDAANNQTGDALVVQEAPVTNFTIINNLGVETVKSNEFILYPNPASEVVYLVMGSNTAETNDLKLKVFNMLGQVVEETSIQNNTTELSTKNWGASGVYFVEVTNSDSTVLLTKKVIVNRK